MNSEQIIALMRKEFARAAELGKTIANPASSSAEVDEAFDELEVVARNTNIGHELLNKIKAGRCKREPIRYITADANFIVIYRGDRYRIYKNTRCRHAAILRHCAIGDGRLIPVRAVCADNGGFVCG